MGLALTVLCCSPGEEKPSVKSILVEQLKNTHTNKDWYVPINVAIAGLTSEQSNWEDTSNNHSIGELVAHLIFWNERVLVWFQGGTPPAFNDDNEITFRTFAEKDWDAAVGKIDSLQSAWEHVVEEANEEQLEKWSTSIANICTHNAYHTGQIVYIRKMNGWWDDEKGVK